jgi:hypothetical protein
MFQFMRGSALIGAMFLSGRASFAEVDSANHMMAGCRSLIANAPNDPFNQGKCVGIVISGIVCAPRGSTSGQGLRIVVKFIDDRPERMHENFTVFEFLFGGEITDYLEAVRQTMIRHEAQKDAAKSDNDTVRARAADIQAAAFTEISQFFEKSDSLIAPYMRMHQKLPE